MWVGLIQSVEALNKTKTDLPVAKRNSARRLIEIELQLFLESLDSLTCRFWIYQASIIVWTNCLKSLSLFLYLYIDMDIDLGINIDI